MHWYLSLHHDQTKQETIVQSLCILFDVVKFLQMHKTFVDDDGFGWSYAHFDLDSRECNYILNQSFLFHTSSEAPSITLRNI
jgi:hypothetical protein